MMCELGGLAGCGIGVGLLLPFITGVGIDVALPSLGTECAFDGCPAWLACACGLFKFPLGIDVAGEDDPALVPEFDPAVSPGLLVDCANTVAGATASTRPATRSLNMTFFLPRQRCTTGD